MRSLRRLLTLTRAHVLTAGFTSPNGCAFLFPLIVHRRALADCGIEITLFTDDSDRAAVSDCDVLILDSKFYSPRWVTESDAVLDRIAALAEAAPKLFYFDITDSSGWDHARALPLVTAYFKNQLLRDRTRYLSPLYGHRLYADYYHRHEGVGDERDERSEPVASPALLAKLQVGWNSGLADYALFGPLRMAAFRRMAWPALLKTSQRWVPAERPRPRGFTCRIGTGYARHSVAWQRRAIRERLAARLSTDKLGRRAYLRELAESRIVISPFGLGEITLRDFEIFVAGALALKPDMSHMETWPDLFRDGETIATHRWDLSDLEEKIEVLSANDARRVAMAQAAQTAYRRHLDGEEAARLFVERFAAILKVGERPEPAVAE